MDFAGQESAGDPFELLLWKAKGQFEKADCNGVAVITIKQICVVEWA